jgi:hypothetical protein
MGTIGVLYVAYGPHAVKEATESVRTLRRHHDWPVAVIGNEIGGTDCIDCPDHGLPGRWPKVNIMRLSPYRWTLYLDADTRIHGRLDIGFRILADGWDLVIVPSEIQGKPLHHLDAGERDVTLNELGDRFPLMLNTGVMWFRRSERLGRFSEEWRREWQRFRRHDQGALLRALERCPVRLWLLGRDYNGGEIVEHRFGKAAG